MAFPSRDRGDPQRVLEARENGQASKTVLLERVLSQIEAEGTNVDAALTKFECGLIESKMPKGAAAVTMDLDGMIDNMLQRPKPIKNRIMQSHSLGEAQSQRQRPPSPPSVSARGNSGCHRCEVLAQQVTALGQALTGFCSLAFHWSAGLPEVRRQGLVELALDYAGPCAHIYADLADLCVELEHIRWGDKAPTAKKRPGAGDVNESQSGAAEDLEQSQEEFRPQKPTRELDWWSDEPEMPTLTPVEASGPRLVGNYGASRDDDSAAYLVDNSKLKAKSAGLGYRRSPNMEDKDGRAFAKWGSIVHGMAVGNEWVKVEGRYLPRVVSGVSVVVPHQKGSPVKSGVMM